MDSLDEVVARLKRRLERERVARREAEQIAERVTAELYASKGDLQAANSELQSLNQTMREFVAIASHDLRSPLTSIMGAASMLVTRDDKLSPAQKGDMLAIIQRQAQHLARMVEDLLTVSKIEAGQLDTAAEVVKMRVAIEHSIRDFGQSTDDIKLECDDCEAVVDPEHLHRIITNYLGNALKYGIPPIAVRVYGSGDWVEIHVCDQGEGVPADLVPRLFDKFARGERAREMGGSGLGLSIVQGLARANGGDTWYQPNEPQGSCFVVRLPQRAA